MDKANSKTTPKKGKEKPNLPLVIILGVLLLGATALLQGADFKLTAGQMELEVSPK